MALSLNRIQHLTGGVDTITAGAILRAGATEADLASALAWFRGENGDLRVTPPQTPAARAVYQLLVDALVEPEEFEGAQAPVEP